MEDVVQDVEIIEKLEVLKNEPDICDSESASLRVAELVHLYVVHIHGAPRGHDDSGNEVQERGLARAARPYDGDLL